MLFEMIIMIIANPVGVDTSLTINTYNYYTIFTINALIFFIGLFKNYIFLRYFQQISKWTNENSSIICKKYKCNPSLLFVIKCELKYRPYLFITLFMVITIIFFGIAFRHLE